MPNKPLAELLPRLKRHGSYPYEELLRDLEDLKQELKRKIKEIDDRLEALESP